MRQWLKISVGFAMLAALLSAATAIAASTADSSDNASITSPYLLIEDITAEVLAKIDVHRRKIDSSKTEAEKKQQMNCYFDDIEASLDSVVDFIWIARNVMGPYRKTSTSAQREAFAEVFRTGLVETYGRGLLAYSDEEIVVLPGGEDYTGKRKVSVRQEVRSADGNHPLEYTMGLNKAGHWRIINVIINGINLGKTFRNQFVQDSQKNDGNIDRVIANWGSEVI
ncbi:MAG: ABC transporter substrate-binding protein [Gammaproteobacteria bacterium]|nr:MAG: ABC transporter substrate-binding protein [Gammaproteobacteria bacterium]RLA53595.1 MAG: ABC transporter substrate-binding protein [Gammaproteobacteria bacterium]